MERFLNYLKCISIFLIFELLISFLASLLNLIGVQSGITQIILLLSNVILFFILSYLNASKMKKRGIIEGLLIGTILLAIMALLKLLLFNDSFTITTLLYYFILLLTSIIGGLIGVNKKNDK